MGIKCFFLEPIPDLYEYSLRRYTTASEKKCPNTTWGHGAATGCLWKGPASDVPSTNTGDSFGPGRGDYWPHDDTRWPKTCVCSYVFQEEDEWQLIPERVYCRFDTGEQIITQRAPVGAMFFADWMCPTWAEFDGRCLSVKLPGDHWWFSGQRASNCDMACTHCGKPYNAHVNIKGERTERCQPNWTYNDGNPYFQDRIKHRCWVRHGTPPHEIVHVDKNGITCSAGAGSIAIPASGSHPGWHGFLHNGELVG